MATTTVAPGDLTRAASELRIVLGQLVRRLRREHSFPISHGAVLGRLDREGAQTASALAVAERVRPQSMAQTLADLEGDDLVARRPDPADRRQALVELTARGRQTLRNRAGRVRRGREWTGRGSHGLLDIRSVRRCRRL